MAAIGSRFTFPKKMNSNAFYQTQYLHFTIRASQSIDDKDGVYKQLGLFSLKKKIEDAIVRAEMLAPSALEREEETKSRQQEAIRDYDLWDDIVKSNEILRTMADTSKAVDALKDLNHKVEETKLITQLAEMDAVNYGLFEKAYDASLDVSKFLHRYEMSKLLKEPYDMEGACMIITARSGDTNSKAWAEVLLSMYTKWAEKQGYSARVVDKHCCANGGISSATIEFEFEYAYGYISGERGAHCLIRSSKNGSLHDEEFLADVDVFPLFIRTTLDLQINDEDFIMIGEAGQRVCIQHIPTGMSVESSGERSYFANKMKALNRLKAKLVVIAKEQGVSDVHNISRDAIVDSLKKVTRNYVSHPRKLVHDVKTGLQIHNLNSILDGNIEPLIGAHINMRRTHDAI